MLDEPPTISIELADPEQGQIQESKPSLPIETREDGTVVIDLTGLAPPPMECVDREPDPLNPEIVVCRSVMTSPRLGADYGPSADEIVEGSAIPRARFRFSENAEAQANVINKAVGGWNANGAEAKVKIDF